MTRKASAKPYWEMTTEELRKATKEFDEEFVADKGKPLNREMRARWERAKAKGEQDQRDNEDQVIAVQLDKDLLARCTALAKKKRITRDCLIARGLKAILAAEGAI